MLHKLNGQINALLVDFCRVENGGRGDFTAAATAAGDRQDPQASGPTEAIASTMNVDATHARVQW
jgi:hypothetical protein